MKDRETWHAAAHGVTESDTTERRDNNIYLSIYLHIYLSSVYMYPSQAIPQFKCLNSRNCSKEEQSSSVRAGRDFKSLPKDTHKSHSKSVVKPKLNLCLPLPAQGFLLPYHIALLTLYATSPNS